MCGNTGAKAEAGDHVSAVTWGFLWVFSSAIWTQPVLSVDWGEPSSNPLHHPAGYRAGWGHFQLNLLHRVVKSVMLSHVWPLHP